MSAIAQPSIQGTINFSVSNEAVGSVDVFYDQLSPYGLWIDDPDLGRVFIPERSQFVPYTDGYWQYTDVGFVWVSNEPFDWATSHYGRWAYSQPYLRWVWLPDTTWGPSWVEWRESGDYYGWAPMAPQVAIEYGYSAPSESWHYCASAHILDVNVRRYYEPRQRVVAIHREARPAEYYATVSNTRVVVGPPVARLREQHIAVRPTKLAPRAMGRLTRDEAQVAVRRAQERRPVIEQQNRKRLEAHPTFQKAQTRAPVRATAKPAESPRPPARVEPQPPARSMPPMRQQPPARNEPPRAEPPARVEPKQPPRTEPPARVEPKQPPRAEPPARVEPPKQPPRAEPPARNLPPPKRDEPKKDEPRKH